jgi:CRISPR-associated protein Cpf1
MLEENKVFAKDEIIQRKYEATKPFFDRLHREFIVEALTKVSFIGLSDYQEALNAWQKDRQNIELKKTYDKTVQELRKQVVVYFDDKALFELFTNNIFLFETTFSIVLVERRLFLYLK